MRWKRASYRRRSMPQIFLRARRIATTIPAKRFSRRQNLDIKRRTLRNYATHHGEYHPRAFPKRFMNYVDRSWCGRSVCKPAARSSAECSWSFGRMLFAGDGFDGWIHAIDSIPRAVTLYQAAIVIMQSRHSSELSHYSRLSTTLTRIFGNASIRFNYAHVAKQAF